MLMVTHKTSSSEAFGRPASCHPRAATARPAHWLRAPHEDDRASARDTPPTDPMQLTERSRPAMPKRRECRDVPSGHPRTARQNVSSRRHPRNRYRIRETMPTLLAGVDKRLSGQQQSPLITPEPTESQMPHRIPFSRMHDPKLHRAAQPVSARADTDRDIHPSCPARPPLRTGVPR